MPGRRKDRQEAQVGTGAVSAGDVQGWGRSWACPATPAMAHACPPSEALFLMLLRNQSRDLNPGKSRIKKSKTDLHIKNVQK